MKQATAFKYIVGSGMDAATSRYVGVVVAPNGEGWRTPDDYATREEAEAAVEAALRKLCARKGVQVLGKMPLDLGASN